VIGGAVLVAGLLLVLAALVAARVPDGAVLVPSGIGRTRAVLLAPIHPATWYANASVAIGAVVGVVGFIVVASLVSVGLATLAAVIGLAFIALAIEASRFLARIERRRTYIGEPTRPAAHPYRPLRGGALDIVRAEFADENRWRDLVYVGVNLPLAVIEFSVLLGVWGLALLVVTTPIWYDAASGTTLPWFLGPLAGHDALFVASRVVLGLLLLMAAASLSQLVIALHRGVVNGLLCTSESRELRREVETLRQSRSAVLDTEASELHRIERDLHDGAQQRLVALTIDLGLAGERIDTDPEAAKALILDGQAQAREALAEIRDLVRGIAPSILLDRGLVAAVESLVGRGPVPTVIRSDLAPGERFAPAVERTAYFVAGEALANVAKHGAASRCEVRLFRLADAGATSASRLVVEVWDDGRGGARIAPGGGLEGLESRVAGVDGTFAVSSPDGGPTLIRAEIPVAGAAAPTTGT
jgi:signal transduction histidine kinase